MTFLISPVLFPRMRKLNKSSQALHVIFKATHRIQWLVAPSLLDVGFALRTSLAAVISLYIAMWMELDSPQWAPLTVWVVATASRGETISKARWRLGGTILGCLAGVTLMAVFPQYPGLFFIFLAIWIGVCYGSATLFRGYRRYGFLVMGFTSAIVATGAIANPNTVFDVAIARGTYILLGNLCEALTACLFLYALQRQARKRLITKLTSLINDTFIATTNQTNIVSCTKNIIPDIVNVNDKIGFDILEMGTYAQHADAHARAALARLLSALVRFRGSESSAAIERDISVARNHIRSLISPYSADNFTFNVKYHVDWVESFQNGLRAFVSIICAWLIWEVTAWSSGAAFISFVALVYGLLSTRDVPFLATSGFFQGAVLCALTAAIYVFLIIPSVTTPEYFSFLLFIPMLIGGLAARRKSLVNHAFSFNMFLPVLLGPSNLNRYDEISFLNNTTAFLGAILYSWLIFGVVWPFHADARLHRSLNSAKYHLKNLGRNRSDQSVHYWIISNSDSIVRVIRSSNNISDEIISNYVEDYLDIITLGMWIIELNRLSRSASIPSEIRTRLRVFLRAWSTRGDTNHSVALLTLASLEKRKNVAPIISETLKKISSV